MTLPSHARQKWSPPAGRLTAIVAVLPFLLVGCSVGTPSPTVDTPSPASTGTSRAAEPDTTSAEHPDVLAASLERNDDGSWRLEVTLSSQYDSPKRYADGWRVLDEDDEVLGQHTLTHDHADEQPVTRTQSGLQIPDGVDEVTIQGKDTENGYGGATLAIPVPRQD